MSGPTLPAYKTLNWPAYNEALKRRGSLTIWFDPAMAWEAAPTGKRGRQPDYSDAAIQTCLTMKVLFGMALRQTTGFIESLLRLIGLDWSVPDFSTLSMCFRSTGRTRQGGLCCASSSGGHRCWSSLAGSLGAWWRWRLVPALISGRGRSGDWATRFA